VQFSDSFTVLAVHSLPSYGTIFRPFCPRFGVALYFDVVPLLALV
jgi:hypothetical protein